jgi:hypothetical protein
MYVTHPSPIPVGFWRSVGMSINTFAVESTIDQMAALAGKDPYLFRRGLLTDPRWIALLDAVANLSNWSAGPAPGHGMGIAIGGYANSIVAEVVDVSLVSGNGYDGQPSLFKVNNVWIAMDCYLTVNPSQVQAVLATVAHVTGSSYRRPGARMLIVPDGRRIGCVSGGCLEGEIVRKAWWFTESGAPVVRVYDTTSEDDAVWEFGLGCNSVVHVMLERVNMPAASGMLHFLDAQRAARKPSVVATVIRTGAASGIQVGDRLLLDESWIPSGNLSGSAVELEVLMHAAALREKRSRLAHLGTADVFVEWIGPPSGRIPGNSSESSG